MGKYKSGIKYRMGSGPGRYIELQTRLDAALLNCKPKQSPNLSQGLEGSGSHWDLMKLCASANLVVNKLCKIDAL